TVLRRVGGARGALRRAPPGPRRAPPGAVRAMRFWICAAVLAAASLGLAFSPVNEYFFYAAYVVLTFVVLATAWNILGGYAGYVHFGTPALFAIGAYTAVVLFKWLGGGDARVGAGG